MMTLDDRTAERLRRRHGYRFRPARPEPVHRMIERAGGRLIPLNRSRPGDGLAYTSCPRCARWDGLWINPDGTWSTLCDCAPTGNRDAVDLAFFLRDAACANH